MNKYIIVIAIFLLSLSSLAQAQCIARPSCADMGYNKTATQCAGKDYLRCPFDTSAYFCGEVCDFSNFPLQTCPANGVCSNYTCRGITKYKLDSCIGCYRISGNSCVEERECCGFNYDRGNLVEGELACENKIKRADEIDGIDSMGFYTEECYSSSTYTPYYRVLVDVHCLSGESYFGINCDDIDSSICPECCTTDLSCPYGCAEYDECGCCVECAECDFSSYPLSSCPTGGNCSIYTCGGTTKYRLDSCEPGYTQNGNTCNACSWGSYTLSYCESFMGTCEAKTCGGKKQYKYTSCKSNYYLSGNNCYFCSCMDEDYCEAEDGYLDYWHEKCGCYTACCWAGGCEI